MNKTSIIKYFILILIISITSCSKDDDGEDSISNFYSGAVTSASVQEIEGIWAFFSGEFEEILVDIPINYQDCGRDFFIFSENGVYTEYLFQSSNCDYNVNTLNWTLDSGVITLSNNIGQSDQLVITALNQTQLNIKTRFDVDEDGELDILTLNAQRYQPIEIDLVSPTFYRNDAAAFQDRLSFTWDSYQGFNEFDRIEIYRSFGYNCSKDNAILIETITDVSTTEFSDLTPPGEEQLCYYMKIYTNQGFLGESSLFQQYTENMYPDAIGLDEPIVNGNQIEFSWEVSNSYYFSHYEIVYSNYSSGSGSGFQDYTSAMITDVNTTQFIEENPPYLEDPFYKIFVHNIFGNKNQIGVGDVTWYWEVPFKRDELIGFESVHSYAADPEEHVVYFAGLEIGTTYPMTINRFNYSTNVTEAVADLLPNTSTNIPIKITLSSNGKEVVVAQGLELYFYDAVSMAFKYAINPEGISTFDDFIYLNDDYWALINNNNIFTYMRDNANFTLVDSKPHFTDSQSNFNYQVFSLADNKLLVGHKNESNSIIYSLNMDGTMTNNQTVSIPITDDGYFFNKSLYNSSQGYIINFNENRIYSTTTYSLLESFESPYYSTGISLDGSLIYGSNNNPDWQITAESLHAKEAIILNRGAQSVVTIETIGYPHAIFANYAGEVISISSGFKKQGLNQNINDKGDIFIEIVDIP